MTLQDLMLGDGKNKRERAVRDEVLIRYFRMALRTKCPKGLRAIWDKVYAGRGIENSAYTSLNSLGHDYLVLMAHKDKMRVREIISEFTGEPCYWDSWAKGLGINDLVTQKQDIKTGKEK